MIRSLTTVSSPFKGNQFLLQKGKSLLFLLTHVFKLFIGSQGVYLLGATTAGTVRPFSFGAWLGRFVHIYEYLDIKWLKSITFDFNVDHWNLSFRKNWDVSSFLSRISNKTITSKEESVELMQETTNTLCSAYGLLQCLYKSPWLSYVDNAPYDMTIHAMKEVNATSKTFEKTFYRTYATSIVSFLCMA